MRLDDLPTQNCPLCGLSLGPEPDCLLHTPAGMVAVHADCLGEENILDLSEWEPPT